MYRYKLFNFVLIAYDGACIYQQFLYLFNRSQYLEPLQEIFNITIVKSEKSIGNPWSYHILSIYLLYSSIEIIINLIFLKIKC
jgi:hypothetical protein